MLLTLEILITKYVCPSRNTAEDIVPIPCHAYELQDLQYVNFPLIPYSNFDCLQYSKFHPDVKGILVTANYRHIQSQCMEYSK